MNEAKFNKKIELLFGLQYCASRHRNTNFDWIYENNKEYCDKFYELYLNNITKEFEDYIISGGLDGYNRVVTLGLHLDDNYCFFNKDSMDKQLLNNPNVNLSLIEKYLKEFVNKSNYDKFFNSNKDYYDYVIGKFYEALNIFEKFDINKLINFFGYKKADMNVYLINFSTGSYGATENDSLNYVCCARSVYKDEFRFSDSVIMNAYHEFSHPYINPINEKYFNNMSLDYLYSNAKENGLEKCYYHLLTLLNEYVVRAISIYLIKDLFEEKNIKRLEDRVKLRGYKYISELIQLFDNRKNYDNFELFYESEIVPFFININEKLKNEVRSK